MAILRSIFQIPTNAQIAFLKFDASMSETHSRTATISDNEIEDGATISDHIKLNPNSLSMELFISDAPVSILGLGVSTDDILGAADDFLDGQKGKFEGLIKNERRTPKESWEYLNQLMENRTPFSVVTGLKRYENMVLTSLSAPRNSKIGRGLSVNVELRKIVTVKSAVVQIPAFKVAAGQTKNSATSKGKTGKQSAKEATDKQKDNSSLLLQGFKKVGIF